MASTDRDLAHKRLEDAQLEKLSRQMQDIQGTMVEQSALRRKLENLMEAESARQEKTFERVSSRNLKLQEEIDRKFGSDGESPSRSPIGSNKLLDQVMSLRTKEFQKSQAKKAGHMQNLVQERQRILDARNRLQEKKERYRALPSPVGSDVSVPSTVEMHPPNYTRAPNKMSTPSYRSIHSATSNVKRAVDAMPLTVDRIWAIREDLSQHYEEKRKPYEGEMGMGTYEKWQLPDYFMVRQLVNDFVEEFLVKHTPPDSIVFEREMRLHVENQRYTERDSNSKLLAERKGLTLVAEEILLQVTKQMTRDIGVEVHQTQHLYRNLSSNAFIKAAEIEATGNPEGRDPSEDEYDLLTRAFLTLQKDRDRKKKSVWAHSQVMSHPIAVPVKPLPRDRPHTERRQTAPPVREDGPKLPPRDELPIDPDVLLIRHNHLTPEHLRLTRPMKTDDSAEKRRKFWRQVYKKWELKYWTNLKPFMFTVPLPKRGQGVEVAVPSPDHMLVAVGMTSGDVFVLNTVVEPWSVVKFYLSPTGQGSVRHLAWSLDSSHLMAVHKEGSVSVWNVNGVQGSKAALKAMGVAAGEGKQLPMALSPITSLDAKKGDFTIESGPLSSTDTGSTSPVAAHFFPSLTYLSSQSVACVGFQSGDVFKFDILGRHDDTNRSRNMVLKPTIPSQEEETNRTKLGVGVEVFKQHSYTIMLLGCINNVGKMVSMDTMGFLNVWKYDPEHSNQNGCYVPESKYRIDFNKTMYMPMGGDKVKVVFTDRNRSKSTTQEAIARERREAQATLDRIPLGHPWHVIADSPGMETSIYVPAGGVAESAAMFNIVIRHTRTQQLSSYMTRYYTPIKVGCTKLLSVRLSPSGQQMLLVMLYPEFPPKAPHLMVLVLELPSVKLRKFRYDHPITDQQFKDLNAGKLVCSADISQVVGATGGDYLFLTLGKEFRCVSMATGSGVLVIDTPNRPRVPYFRGLVIDEKQFPVSTNQKVCFVGNMGSLYAAFYNWSSSSLQVLRLEEGSNTDDLMAVNTAFKQWERYKPTPMEMRLNAKDWALPDMKHKLAEMRSLLLSLGFCNEPISEQDRIDAKKGHYNALQDEVTAQGLLLDL